MVIWAWGCCLSFVTGCRDPQDSGTVNSSHAFFLSKPELGERGGIKLITMKDFRKVTFYLVKDSGYGLFDFENEKEQEELEEKTKQRQGVFHAWGYEVVTVENESFKNTYAIIEELETGTVYQVVPQNIQFINS